MKNRFLIIVLQAILLVACSKKSEELPQPAAKIGNTCTEYSRRDTSIYYETGQYRTRFIIIETCDSVKVTFVNGEILAARQPTERPDSEVVTSKVSKNVIHIIKTRADGAIFYYLGEQGIYVKSKINYTKL